MNHTFQLHSYVLLQAEHSCANNALAMTLTDTVYGSFYFVQALRSKNETRIAQAKILIVLVYYIAVALGTLGAYSSLARNGKRFREELVKYFTCEAAGTGEPCDRSGYNEYNIPVLEAFGYFFVGLISVANLVYVLNFRKMRGTCRRWCGHGNASSS